MAAKPARDTRNEILERAQTLFAQTGFYGTSIAAIVSELGISKQALLHYFPTKEKLYGEVLRRISDEFERLIVASSDAKHDPIKRIQSYYAALCERSITHQDQTMILMRELLDNRRRAEHVGTWYLTNFLKNLVGMVQQVPGWQKANDPEALALVYQWLGAINYYAISGPTLTGIFGPDHMVEVTRCFPEQLEQLIEASLKAGVRT